MNYKKLVLRLLIVATIVRILVAAGTELSNDEVYYRMYADDLQWNYFDHPPLVALLIRVFTGNLLLQQELWIRLGVIVCAAINTWLMFRIGATVGNERTGWIAACLFTASLYGSVIAGLMILPDGPQMVFWLLAVLLMLKIFKQGGRPFQRKRRLLLLGLVIGLCMLCKIHGIFLWVGAGLYILLYNRNLLRNPYLYLSMVITGLLLLPVLLWNINNDFITYRYHGTRVSFLGAIQWDSFLRQIAGEFFYNNPVNMVLIGLALLVIRKRKWTNEVHQQRLLGTVAFPLVGIVWFMALFRDTLPHWTGPAYTTLIPLAAAWVTDRMSTKLIITPTPYVVRAALAIPLVILIALPLGIHQLQYPLGKKEQQYLGAGDLLLDMSGWKQFGNDFKKVYQSDIATGQMRRNATIIADYWFPAAHLDHYVAGPAGINFLAIGSLHNIHQYAWLNLERSPLKPGDDAYYIAISNYFDPPSATLLMAFEKNDPPMTIAQYRGKVRVRNFFIYRLRGYKGGIANNGIVADQ